MKAVKYLVVPVVAAAIAVGGGLGTANADPMDDFAQQLGTYTTIGGFAGTALGAGVGCAFGSAATAPAGGSIGCLTGGLLGGLVGGAGIGGVVGTLIGGSLALPSFPMPAA